MACTRPRAIAPVTASPHHTEPLAGSLALASSLLSAPMADSALQAASMADGGAQLPTQYCRGGGGDSGGAALHLHHGWVAWYTTSLPQPVPSHFIKHRVRNLAMKILCLNGRSRVEVPRGPPACLTVTSGRVLSPFPTFICICFFYNLAYYCCRTSPLHHPSVFFLFYFLLGLESGDEGSLSEPTGPALRSRVDFPRV